MQELINRLASVKEQYAHWNADGENQSIAADCSPLDCNSNMCHGDGECGGDGE